MFFFNGFEQHGLFVQAQFAYFVQKQHAAVGGFQIAFALFRRAGKRAFFVAEQGGSRTVAAQGGAVHIDKLAFNQMARFFQFENPACQHRFARAGRTGEQNR